MPPARGLDHLPNLARLTGHHQILEAISADHIRGDVDKAPLVFLLVHYDGRDHRPHEHEAEGEIHVRHPIVKIKKIKIHWRTSSFALAGSGSGRKVGRLDASCGLDPAAVHQYSSKCTLPLILA